MKHIDRARATPAANVLAGWDLYELVLEQSDGDVRSFAVSTPIARAGKREVKDIGRAMRSLRAAGVPLDASKVRPEFEAWKESCPGDHQQSTFWVLKAKPSGWRLYCTVNHATRSIFFLYAVHKKRDDRNSRDFAVLCRHYQLLTAHARCAPLHPLLVGG